MSMAAKHHIIPRRRYKPGVCPNEKCESPNTGVARTLQADRYVIRYLKCDDCGYTWTDSEKKTS